MIEGTDDPITPAQHGPFGVVVEALGMNITGDVEPVDGLALAEAGGKPAAV